MCGTTSSSTAPVVTAPAAATAASAAAVTAAAVAAAPTAVAAAPDAVTPTVTAAASDTATMVQWLCCHKTADAVMQPQQVLNFLLLQHCTNSPLPMLRCISIGFTLARLCAWLTTWLDAKLHTEASYVPHARQATCILLGIIIPGVVPGYVLQAY